MKKERWRTRVLFFLLLACATVFARNPVPNGLKIGKSSNGYQINFELPQYQFVDDTGDNEGFDRIAIDGYGINTDEGLPALPQCSFNLIILDSKSIPRITIDQVKTRQEVISKHIYPVQQPWPKSKPFSERPFSINREYYKSEGTKNHALYSISEPFEIAGVTAVTITLHPFTYNPSKKSLEVIDKMTIQVESKHKNMSMSKGSAFEDIYNSSFVNSSDFISYTTDTKAAENYLVITAPSFQSTLSRFVDYRHRRGMNVNVFSTNETGTITTQIKSFIQSRYDNISTRPSYILLVGDVDQIPAWTSTNADYPHNDLYYSTLAGTDYFPDAQLGRFSVSSTSELTNIINKTIYMDSLISDLSKKAVFLASSDRNTITEGTQNYVITNYFSLKGYNCTKRYCVSTSATTAQVLSDLNLGQTFAIYSGHGTEISWEDGPQVSQSQVRSLTNSNVYPFVYGFTCLSGSYYGSEGFGETWIRSSSGASSYWGSSVTSYWDEDDILEKETFKAVYQDSITGLAASFNRGKIALYNYYSGGGRTYRYFEQYNLLGDPALSIDKSWSQGVNLQYSSSVITETSGNNDGILNPGETANLLVSLKNMGTSDATLVNAQLTTNDSYVTITNSASTFGDIAARGTVAAAQQPFTIAVSSQCPIPRTITLGLTIHDGASGQWTSEFTITINTSSTISGFVRSMGSETPIANATVLLFSGLVTDSVHTDVNGHFSSNVIEGTYSVSALAQGYFNSPAQQITTPPNATDILFLMRRPEIHVTPSCIDDTLLVNQTKTSVLTINNTGYEPLSYSLVQSFKGSTVPAESLYDASHYAVLPKDVVDNRAGLPVNKGSGGPDSYGYNWIDSDNPSGPAYVWDDISTSGQQLSLSDESIVKVALPFTFKFYGTAFDSVYICSNGYVSFGRSYISYSNTPIPNSYLVNNFAAAFWDDLNPGTGGRVYLKYYSDRAVIQFQEVPQNYSTSGTYTFQIVLHSNGNIMYYYKSMTGALNSSTIGIENSTCDIGLQIAYNTSYIHDNMAVKISSAPEWITVTPVSGTIAARSSQNLQIQLSSINLVPGVYESTISIQHNDPSNALPVSVPVKMTVTEQEALTLLPLTAGTSTLPADRSGQLILENITAGSAASGAAIGSNFKLYLH